MTAATDSEQLHPVKKHIAIRSRGISIGFALLLDLYLVWLFLLHNQTSAIHKDTFWTGAFAWAMVYSIVQQLTLSLVTGKGDDFTSALDKFVALSPLVVIAVLEAYLIGAHRADAISMRVHMIALFWAAFSLADFFSTDIVNQRLRGRQINLAGQQ